MAAPRRLLVVRPDRVGDVIISSSCIPALQAAYPRAEIAYAAPAVMQPLFETHPALAAFIPLPSHTLPFHTRVGALYSTLKDPRFDCVVSLHPDPAVYLATWWVGIRRRIGYPSGLLSWTLTDCLPNRRPGCLAHEAAYNFDLLQPLGLALPKRLRASIALPPKAEVSLREKLDDHGLLANYYCLHLGAHSPVFRWPVERYVELARRLRQRHGATIVLVGHDAADASYAEFRALAGDAVPYLDLSGKLDLAELGWLLQDAQCLITRDSGPSHLAAAVNCPVVVLFGRLAPPYGPTRWAPLGERVRVVPSTAVRRKEETRDGFHRRAFAAITTDAVADAVEQVCAKVKTP
jgi:heptosyltransferase-2